MREYVNPVTVTVPADANLADTVFDNAQLAPDDIVFRRNVAGAWHDLTARDFAAQVQAVAKGLIASGVAAGDRVGLMSRTRYEWTLFDYAIWSAGAVTVPVYETSSAEQVSWYLGDSGAVAVVVEDHDHKATAQEARAELPDVGHVWAIEGGAVAALSKAGRAVPDETVTARRAALHTGSLATIIYTSGTTGRPKGCELTHGNFLWDVQSVSQGAPELFRPHASTLLFLPLAHVFARLVQCGCVSTRTTLGHTANVKNLTADLAEFSPTFILSVPRVFEKVYNTAKHRAYADGRGRVFDLAESVAVRHSEAVDQGGPGLLLQAQHLLFDRLVYAKLRSVLGGRVEFAVSGGAPLGARLGHFYRGIGVPVLEGYGLTETTAAACLNLPEAVRVGSVGRPVPGAAARIAEDGEVLLRGGHVFRGYWHNEQATKDVLEEDGWFRTGDLGELDADGFLTITGRKKELIVTAAGKNVSPAVLEDRLRAHPLVSHCMVVGDQRPFVGCLIAIDPEAFPDWKQRHGKPADATVRDLQEDPDLGREIQAAVDGANRAVSKAEGIKRFRILPVDFTEEGRHLTPTLKLKRAVVLKDFEDEIAAIYR